MHGFSYLALSKLFIELFEENIEENIFVLNLERN